MHGELDAPVAQTPDAPFTRWAITYVLALIAVTLAGCAPELSRRPDISIKPSLGQGYGQWTNASGGVVHCGHTIADILCNRNRGLRVISSVDLSPRFDFISYAGDNYDIASALETKALPEAFGLSVRQEVRETLVYVLVRLPGAAVGLSSSPATAERGEEVSGGKTCCHWPFEDLFRPYVPTKFSFRHHTMGEFAYYMERWMEIGYLIDLQPPHESVAVIDETGLDGAFDFEILIDAQRHVKLLDSLHQLVRQR